MGPWQVLSIFEGFTTSGKLSAMLAGGWAGTGGLERPLGRPTTREPTEGVEEPTEGVEESTEGEGGPPAAAALRGRLERPLRRPPAGESTAGEEESTEGAEEPAATTPMEAIVQPGGGERTVARRSGWPLLIFLSSGPP